MLLVSDRVNSFRFSYLFNWNALVCSTTAGVEHWSSAILYIEMCINELWGLFVCCMQTMVPSRLWTWACKLWAVRPSWWRGKTLRKTPLFMSLRITSSTSSLSRIGIGVSAKWSRSERTGCSSRDSRHIRTIRSALRLWLRVVGASHLNWSPLLLASTVSTVVCRR